MIYLSWSIYQAIIAFLGLILVYFYLKDKINTYIYPRKRKIFKNTLNVMTFGVFMLCLALAINVGDKEAANYRINFDVEPSVIQNKKENTAPTSESTYGEFLNKLEGEIK